jgi:hypothetical protein
MQRDLPGVIGLPQRWAHDAKRQDWPAFKVLGTAMREAPTFEEGQRRLPALLAEDQDTLPEVCRYLEAEYGPYGSRGAWTIPWGLWTSLPGSGVPGEAPRPLGDFYRKRRT